MERPENLILPKSPQCTTVTYDPMFGTNYEMLVLWDPKISLEARQKYLRQIIDKFEDNMFSAFETRVDVSPLNLVCADMTMPYCKGYAFFVTSKGLIFTLTERTINTAVRAKFLNRAYGEPVYSPYQKQN